MALKNYVDKVGPVLSAVWLNAVDTQTVGNIKNYLAVPGVDCAALVTQNAADNKEIIFPAGAWVITSTPTIPTGTIIRCLPGATFTGVGAGILGLANSTSIVGYQISDYNPPVTGELATVNIFRNPHYVGGSAGVNMGLRVQVNVGTGVTNFEWAITGIVNNLAGVGVGNQVGVYGQGNKGALGVRGGPTWGVTAEARDKSGLADPTDGLVGIEIDNFADGTDNTGTGRRIGADIVVGTAVSSKNFARYGLRIGPFNNDTTQGEFAHGVYLQNRFSTALIKYVSVNSTPVGIDLASGNISGPSLRIAQNQFISFDINDLNQLSWDTVGFALNVSGGIIARINSASGILNLGTAGAYGASDSIITQVALPVATISFSHRAQDLIQGTARSGAILANHTILTNITVANYRAFEITTPTLQAGALVTNNDGFYCNDMTTGGTRNTAANFNVTSGAGKWNLFAQGSASNLMGGMLNLTSGAAAASVTNGIGLGGTTQVTIGANGAASALTANPLGYWICFVGATKVIFPYYNG